MSNPAKLSLWILPPAFLIILALVFPKELTDAREQSLYTVSPSRFEQWIPLMGEVAASNPVPLRSEMSGPAKVLWIVKDGTPVEQGDLLARFDPSSLEEQRLQADRDVRRAQAALTALTDARHPLELQALRQQARTLDQERAKAARVLTEVQSLVNEGLMSKAELTQLEQETQQIVTDQAALADRIRLTRDVLHPAVEEQAAAELEAARLSLERLENQIAASEVTAPIRGIVHLPRIPIDNTRRAVRVGDTLFRNQVYLELADLTDLEVTARVPERFLFHTQPGLTASVHLPAFPQTDYTAHITSVATRPEDDGRSYPVRLKFSDPAHQLQPGLTAEIRLRVFEQDQALVLPWDCLQMENGDAFVLKPGNPAIRQTVELGPANDLGVLVTSGLKPGDRVLRP